MVIILRHIMLLLYCNVPPPTDRHDLNKGLCNIVLFYVICCYITSYNAVHILWLVANVGALSLTLECEALCPSVSGQVLVDAAGCALPEII